MWMNCNTPDFFSIFILELKIGFTTKTSVDFFNILCIICINIYTNL